MIFNPSRTGGKVESVNLYIESIQSDITVWYTDVSTGFQELKLKRGDHPPVLPTVKDSLVCIEGSDIVPTYGSNYKDGVIYNEHYNDQYLRRLSYSDNRTYFNTLLYKMTVPISIIIQDVS